MRYDNGHPAAFRTWIRQYLPWFLIDFGIADKITDCEAVNANHFWYCKEENKSGCYHCKVEKDGQLWKLDS